MIFTGRNNSFNTLVILGIWLLQPVGRSICLARTCPNWNAVLCWLSDSRIWTEFLWGTVSVLVFAKSIFFTDCFQSVRFFFERLGIFFHIVPFAGEHGCAVEIHNFITRKRSSPYAFCTVTYYFLSFGVLTGFKHLFASFEKDRICATKTIATPKCASHNMALVKVWRPAESSIVSGLRRPKLSEYSRVRDQRSPQSRKQHGTE